MVGRFYVDTSVWGFLFEEALVEKRRFTESFFNKVKEGRVEIFVSALVIEELDRTKDPILREKLLNSLRDYSPAVLSYDEEVERIAGRIVELGAIPEDLLDDARHIGYTVFNLLDGIVSWNMKHIVKMTTRRVVSAICRIEGYREIDLVTPEEVIYDAGG